MTIKFGRFTDAFKPKTKIDKWNECDKLYTDKYYLQSYVSFFEYLKSDDINNVFYTLENGMLTFQFLQGSKEIRGYSDGKKVSAMAVIAGYEKTNVAVFRRLMELNYSLYYTRFAIKDNKIVLKFDSGISDCTPNKLYYALKELATRADKQDDVLLSEFKSLINAEAKVEHYSAEEITAFTKYYRKWISDTLQRVSGMNREQMSGGISYIFLNLLYRIDYFLMPQGTVLNEMERMSWEYFNNKDMQTVQKTGLLEEDFKKFLEYDDDKLKTNFYVTKSTFGIVQPTGKQGVNDVITNNIENVKWYVDNNYPDVAMIILEYILGYSLFTYGLNVSLRKILGLLMQVINDDFAKEAGVSNDITVNGLPNREFIVNAINECLAADRTEYPELVFDFDKIKFDTKYDFIKTSIDEIFKLNYKN